MKLEEALAISPQTTAPAAIVSSSKRETMYQRLKRLSKEIQIHTDDPKFAWPKD